MSEKIETRHPDPNKEGVNIDRKKYDTIRAAIVSALSESGEMTFSLLTKTIEQNLAGQFEGSIPWYVTTVKLDLEARQAIERVPAKKPQHLRLTTPS